MPSPRWIARVAALGGRLERGALVGAFLVSMALPLSEFVGRPFGGLYVPGSAELLRHATLWLTFFGGLYATREGQHLTLSTASVFGDGSAARAARLFSGAVTASVCAVLARASVSLVLADRQGGRVLLAGVPAWIPECVMPVALGAMAVRFALGASDHSRGRAAALAAIPCVFALGLAPAQASGLFPFLAAAVVGAALLGAPLFAAMGGMALLFFFRAGVPISAVSAEVYRLIASPTLPAIPLLTASGYVLAESRAAERLVRFFRAVFGWMPGGVAVLVAAVCALFTTFTGGSGVTIIALGGLLYPMLRQDGYSERFSLGLLTAAGSLGLLFPPSLPVILYSVVANVPADRLYLAGLVPGLILVALVAACGIFAGLRRGRGTTPFSAREMAASGWGARWELGLPVLVVFLFQSGLASIVETAAAALAYAIVVEVFVTRDIPLRSGLPRVLLKTGALVGAVLLLLSMAMGLTSYLVDAQVPEALIAAARSHIRSPIVFLLVLNLALLVLGSVLEIYSAIVILAPLVAPLGTAFGINPVHLGVIFLANLELGFLFPPLGLNLILASTRFRTPLPRIYATVVPFLLILGAGVVLITYFPQLSLAAGDILGKP